MQSIKNERMAKSFLSPESSISVNIYFFHCVLTHSNKFINAILKRSFQFTQKKKKKYKITTRRVHICSLDVRMFTFLFAFSSPIFVEDDMGQREP